MHVLVSREFLESIEKNVLSERPACRVDAAKVDRDCDSVLLMSDHSLFPGNLSLRIWLNNYPALGYNLCHTEIFTGVHLTQVSHLASR